MRNKILYSLIGIAFVGGLFSAAYAGPVLPTITLGGNAAVTNDFTVGTDAFFVDSANNRVGIGTTSPAAPLHIVADIARIELQDPVADAATGGTILFREGLIQGANIFYDAVANDLALHANQGGVSSITLDGATPNVGIGTASPMEKLHVAGNQQIDGRLAIDGAANFGDDVNVVGTITGDINCGSNCIDSSEISDNTITKDDIGPDAVGSAEIADNAIGISEMQNNAVGSAEIADGSITSNDIADGTIQSADLAFTQYELFIAKLVTNEICNSNVQTSDFDHIFIDNSATSGMFIVNSILFSPELGVNTVNSDFYRFLSLTINGQEHSTQTIPIEVGNSGSLGGVIKIGSTEFMGAQHNGMASKNPDIIIAENSGTNDIGIGISCVDNASSELNFPSGSIIATGWKPIGSTVTLTYSE